MEADIPALRLANHGLASGAALGSPLDAVRMLGAVQAQDYPASLWAIGLRLRGGTEDAIEQAIANRTLVRTWPLRCTLHLVGADDVGWLLQHLAPRVIASLRGRYRQLELEDADFRRAGQAIALALEGGHRLTRPVLYRLLEEAGISTAVQRGIHILQRLALERLICFGPREGRQHTFVLMDEWLPPTPEIDREEALGRLACRYFAGHGPATERDFAWWAGLTLGDVRRATSAAGPALATLSVDDTEYWTLAESVVPQGGYDCCHLLPPFDEYLVGYTDRSAVLDPAHTRRVNNGGGLFAPTIVLGGRIAGTWKRNTNGRHLEVIASPFESLTGAERESISLAAERYAGFLGLSLRLTIAGA